MKIPAVLKGSSWAGEPFETMTHERVLEVLAHVLEHQRAAQARDNHQYLMASLLRSSRGHQSGFGELGSPS